MNVAVFGDVHGHLRLMLQLCRLWQLEHGAHLDLAVQCGDLGFFPSEGTADRATRRFARQDPEELGFARFFARTGMVERDEWLEGVLGGPPEDLGTVRCPVLWCHGNHEDFHALREAVGTRNLVPVDRFGRFLYLQSGQEVEVGVASRSEAPPGLDRVVRLDGGRTGGPTVFPSGAELLGDGEDPAITLRVAAAGGGEEPAGAPEEDWRAEEPLGWVGGAACSRLGGRRFDLLVSHCGSFASKRLERVIEVSQPACHLFAHHGGPVAPTNIGRTRSVWLDDVNFVRSSGRTMHPYGRLNRGCMALLRWGGTGDHDLTVVDEPWMQGVAWSSWRWL